MLFLLKYLNYPVNYFEETNTANSGVSGKLTKISQFLKSIPKWLQNLISRSKTRRRFGLKAERTR
jgi:hypothetical protein